MLLGSNSLTGILDDTLGDFLGDDVISDIVDALKDVANAAGSGITESIDDAIEAVKSAKSKLNFGEDDNQINLNTIVAFAKSIIDGSAADKYSNLDIDSLKDIETLLDYLKADTDSVTQVLRLADVLDKELKNLLGGQSVSNLAFEYLSGVLPGVVDDLLADADLSDLTGIPGIDGYVSLDGLGGFIGQMLGAVADLDFDATGSAVEYLGYVSEALDALTDVYNEVASLFTYDGEYIKGLNRNEIIALLGLDPEAVDKAVGDWLSGVLEDAADKLAAVLDNVGVNTYEVAKWLNDDVIHPLVHATEDFAELRAQLEALFETLDVLYDAAEGYLTESEILDIVGDILEYYGEDIEKAVWALLNGEGITQEGIASAIAKITQEINAAIETARHYAEVLNDIKEQVEAFIDWASGITPEDVRNAAIEAAPDCQRTPAKR
jgi:hypothetical protein